VWRVHELIERVCTQMRDSQCTKKLSPSILKRLYERAALKYLTRTDWERTYFDVWVVVRQKPMVPLLISPDCNDSIEVKTTKQTQSKVHGCDADKEMVWEFTHEHEMSTMGTNLANRFEASIML